MQKLVTPTADPGSKHVEIFIKKTGHLYHQLLVTAHGKEGRAKEAGVHETHAYIAYTAATDMVPELESFIYRGDVSRRLVTISHTDANLGQKEWYIAHVKNTFEELGLLTAPVGFIVVKV